MPRLDCSGGSSAGATAEAALAGYLAGGHPDANGNPDTNGNSDTNPPINSDVNSDVNAAADRYFYRNLGPSDSIV